MKRINFVSILLISIVLNCNLAFGAQVKAFIHYDTETDARSFMQAEPVIILLIASNPAAMNDHYRNIAQGKVEKEIETVTLGTASTPWTNLVTFKLMDNEGNVNDVKFYAQPPQQNQVTFDADTVAERYFFIAPYDTKKLKPGDYTIEAVIGNTISKALTLKIIENRALTGKENIAHLLKFGRYNLLLNKFKEANLYADAISAIEPRNLQGLNLLGDTQAGLGHYKEAYATFQKAIKEYFRQYPPNHTGTYQGPEILIDKAAELKKKLHK